jgi:hypothetical protein
MFIRGLLRTCAIKDAGGTHSDVPDASLQVIRETLRFLRPLNQAYRAEFRAFFLSYFGIVRVPGFAEVIAACTIVLWRGFTVQVF